MGLVQSIELDIINTTQLTHIRIRISTLYGLFGSYLVTRSVLPASMPSIRITIVPLRHLQSSASSVAIKAFVYAAALTIIGSANAPYGRILVLFHLPWLHPDQLRPCTPHLLSWRRLPLANSPSLLPFTPHKAWHFLCPILMTRILKRRIRRSLIHSEAWGPGFFPAGVV